MSTEKMTQKLHLVCLGKITKQMRTDIHIDSHGVRSCTLVLA